jgi:hypothetical protein
MTKGIDLIEHERRRQVNIEGWTPEHDDGHKNGEMAAAGSCYIYMGYLLKNGMSFEVASMEAKTGWPWADEWWKPSENKIRNLVKGGALIAAEIDRLQRAASASNDQAEPRAVNNLKI